MAIPRGQLVALAVLLALLSRGTPVLAVAPQLGNCSPTTQTFSTTTPVAIPTGPAVVSSTITVSGAGPSLWDVDLTTFIVHTFAADLDITLTSPQGTVVTLTTDNGAGNDNVFNGTVWDDQANPEGQVPYTTNSGVATDHPYVNLTPAASLVPEEALAAFRGEDPNGVWTLTISDDDADDGGSLDSWSLAITTFPAPPAERLVTVSNEAPTTIPAGPSVVTSTISVPAGAGRHLVDVNVTTFIQHTFGADLDITLTSPQGIVVTLTTDNGAGNDNIFNGTVWDDQANPGGQVPYSTNSGLATDHPYVNLTPASSLVPEEALAAFNGLNPMGAWTLTIRDDLAGDGGTLTSWSLALTIGQCRGHLITGAGTSGGPHVRVLSGADGSELAGFFSHDPAFPGGVAVAGGDVNGDGNVDIIAGAGPGGGPHVIVFDGVTNSVIYSFFAYTPAFTGGVFVGAADVDGDGHADIVTGAGPGGNPHVRVFSGVDGSELASFMAYDLAFSGGVRVAAADVTGDGLADIITGAGPGGGPHVRVIDGATLMPIHDFFAYDPAFLGGVAVAAVDVNGDTLTDIVTGAGPGGGPHVRVFDAVMESVTRELFAYAPDFTGGVFIGGGQPLTPGHSRPASGRDRPGPARRPRTDQRAPRGSRRKGDGTPGFAPTRTTSRGWACR
jgi:subtilisin-like proprotein convertase family protein